MGSGLLTFDVVDMNVKVQENIKVRWQGREMDSGPITIDLHGSGSAGSIDYETGQVNVEFRVQVRFPELSEMLEDMGAPPGVYAPFEAVIRSHGSVFEDDHSLRLMGRAQLEDHQLFDPAETRIEIRAPSQ